MDDGIADLLKSQKHHFVALRKEPVNCYQEFGFHVLLEVAADFLITAENQAEHNVVKLAQNEESEQVLVLRNVSKQGDDEIEKVAQLKRSSLFLEGHDEVLHQVDDLSEALEVLESWSRVFLIPVYLVVSLHKSLLKHAKIL